MKKTKMPGRGGARAGRTNERKCIKLSDKYCITFPTRGQWRRAVVFAIEALLLAAFVAGVILAAAFFMKITGVL